MSYAEMITDGLPIGMDVSDNYKTFLDIAFKDAIELFGKKKAEWLFCYNEDFIDDLISAYEREAQ